MTPYGEPGLLGELAPLAYVTMGGGAVLPKFLLTLKQLLQLFYNTYYFRNSWKQ